MTEADKAYAKIFQPFAKAEHSTTLVIAQLGQSLDGRIATSSGESKYINGKAALAHLHRLRAHVDAVLVGAGTLVADDPQLTVRLCEGRNPARVVVDPTGRGIPPGKWLANDGAVRLAFSAGGQAPAECDELIRIEAGETQAFEPCQILQALAARGFHRVLVEGGSRVVSSFLDADALDRLHVLVAPMIIGSGRMGLELAPILHLSDARRPAVTTFVFDDGDVLFDCDLRSGSQTGGRA
ncbi:RibD family protein [Roseiarcaceae bacterium H3SJ34-1]|uniref:RibD family protein n=1 Tax=Terripilifer ovatus TaxID=3032367 RepID=UPI003AB98256|nr:RibD family protein [Roseiarcaceae bacterium H3SJ34-1]